MEDNARLKECFQCGGRGKRFVEYYENCGEWFRCNYCLGTGKSWKEKDFPWRPYPEPK